MSKDRYTRDGCGGCSSSYTTHKTRGKRTEPKKNCHMELKSKTFFFCETIVCYKNLIISFDYILGHSKGSNNEKKI